MTDQDAAPLDTTLPPEQFDVGRPIEWMVDPAHPEVVIGVTYEFSQTSERETVWYTSNKRRPKLYVIVKELVSSRR